MHIRFSALFFVLSIVLLPFTPRILTYLSMIFSILLLFPCISKYSLKKNCQLIFLFSFMLFYGMVVEYLILEHEYLPVFSTILKLMSYIAVVVVLAFSNTNGKLEYWLCKYTSKAIFTLLVLAVISLFIPVPSLLGQEYRGIGASGIRATAIYTESGMLSNIAVYLLILFLICDDYLSSDDCGNVRQKVLLATCSIIIVSQSVAGFILLCPVFVYYIRPRLNFNNVVFFITNIIAIVILFYFVLTSYFPTVIERFEGIYELVKLTFNGSLGSLGQSGDGSTWIKLSNLQCVFGRDYSDLLLGDGLYGNERTTHQGKLLSGRADLSSGCAWINSNGAAILWFYLYGVVALLFFYFIAVRVVGFSWYIFLIFSLILSRFGNFPIFLIYFLYVCFLIINIKKVPKKF